jgi:D-aspartate ligase
VNFPWIEYRHRVAGELPSVPPRARTGVYWVHEAGELAALTGRGGPRPSVREALRPWVNPHVHAVADRRDLRPLLRGLKALVAHRARPRQVVTAPPPTPPAG